MMFIQVGVSTTSASTWSDKHSQWARKLGGQRDESGNTDWRYSTADLLIKV